MKQLLMLGLAGFTVLMLFACGGGLPSPDDRTGGPSQPTETVTESESGPNVSDTPSNQSAAPPIPADVTYTIVGQDVLPGIKRSLDIRLNRKVSEDVLRSIAIKLKNSDTNTYQRTFILYYLPGMTIDAGAWAFTHFNPNLKVSIIGLSIEEEQAALKSKPEDPSRQVIGNWLREGPLGSKVTIFRQRGQLFMESTFGDGSSGRHELVEKPSASGRKFERKNRTSSQIDSGEHCLIDRQGDLQFRDQDGLYSTAKKLNTDTQPTTEKLKSATDTQPATEKPKSATDTQPATEKLKSATDTQPATEKPKSATDTQPATEKLKSAETQPDVPSEKEKTAQGRLKLAKKLLERGRKSGAKKWLEEIVRDFPKTKAAQEAKEVLDRL